MRPLTRPFAALRGLAAALILLITPQIHADDLTTRITAAKTNDERACIVATSGYTPALGMAISKELDEQRRAHPPRTDATLASFLEDLGRAHHDDNAVASALTALGVIEETARHWKAAETLYEEAAAVARASGSDAPLADAVFGLSFVHRAGGNADVAFLDILEALAASERTGTQSMTALLLNSAGIWSRSRGDLDAALAYLERARTLMQSRDDREGVAGITNNIGNTWKDLGDIDQAAAAFEQAQALAGRIHNDRVLSYALNNLGSLYVAKHDYERAEEVFGRSLELKRKLHDPSFNTTEVNLGEIARKRRRSAEAFGWYARALADSRAIDDWEHVAEALSDVAVLALDDRRPHLALYTATGAASLAKQHKAVKPFISAMTTRGEALRALGHSGEARAAYEEAIAAVEEERAHASAVPAPGRTLFLERKLDPYFGIISLLRTSHPRDALAHAERTKARVLLDMLHVAPAEAALPHLRDNEAAIEFVTTDDEVLAFVLTGNRVRMRRVALGSAQLSREVRAFRASIAQRDLGVPKEAAKLFEKLFGTIWPLVSDRVSNRVGGKRRLILIPDGPLWELPFAALIAPDGRYLIEHASLTLAPSLKALAAMRALEERREPPGAELIAFGAALSEAEDQARTIAKLYGSSSRVYAGAEATESRLKSEIGNARVVHIATHGALNDASPMYSHLVLNADARNDGLLDAREIARLHLRSDLVVLSACETARGRTRQGEGVIGLSWAFFLAGCPSTVVSQWNVDAATTTALMVRFHERLRAGAPKSDALRDAALSLLRNPRSQHPFYWAPFVLVGDDAAVSRK